MEEKPYKGKSDEKEMKWKEGRVGQWAEMAQWNGHSSISPQIFM
jgi:hypothetical protein